MKSFGQIAYEGYAARTGGKTYDGRDMPEWHDLGRDIQEAWEAAADAVGEHYGRAESLAASVKSFVDGIGFVAPEALAFHVDEKLVKPLADYYGGRA